MLKNTVTSRFVCRWKSFSTSPFHYEAVNPTIKTPTDVWRKKTSEREKNINENDFQGDSLNLTISTAVHSVVSRKYYNVIARELLPLSLSCVSLNALDFASYKELFACLQQPVYQRTSTESDNNKKKCKQLFGGLFCI